MTRKERKKAQELANYILNNITLAEIMSILAKRSTEIANQIVKQKLTAEDYRAIIVSDDSSFKEGVKIDRRDKDSWWNRLFRKLGFVAAKKPPPPEPKPEKKTRPRKGLTGKKRKRLVDGKR